MQQNQVPDQIFMPNSQYPQRKFTFKTRLQQGTQGYVNYVKSENWKYDNNKYFALKFSNKDQVSENELNFLKFIMEYQESEIEQKIPCDMIKVLDIFDFKHNNYNYIITVMEQGDIDLYQYLKANRTKLAEIQKIKICLDITNPIYFLHQKKMLHRDIKPEHYIQVEGKFKLIDFGSIKQSKRAQTIGVGTPIFQAPEIVDNSQNYTDKVDVWALACVFYEVFNEVPLFNYIDYQQIMGKILGHKKDQSEVFQKINQMNCNQQFKQLMQNMLQPQVEKRFDSSRVIGCLQEIYNKMNQQQSLQIQQPFINKMNFSFPSFQQVNNKNCDQNQFKQLEQQLNSKIKILEEQKEKNQLDLENKLRIAIEEKEQKQLEVVSQLIQQKLDKIQQSYQQQIQTLNQKNEQLIQNYKQNINRLENQLQVNSQIKNDFNQLFQKVEFLAQEQQQNQNEISIKFQKDKTQSEFKNQNIINQVDVGVQNQNEYIKKQENQKQETLLQGMENYKDEGQQFQNSIQIQIKRQRSQKNLLMLNQLQ